MTRGPLLPGLCLAAASGAAALAGPEILLSLDAPLLLDGTFRLPPDVVRTPVSGAGPYTTVMSGAPAGIAPGVDIDALHADALGNLYLSADAPFEWQGRHLPDDIVLRTPAGTVTTVFQGQLAGLPPGTNVDGISVLASGDLVMSFDAPVDVPPSRYLPADLVRFRPGIGFDLYWDSALEGIPASADVDAVHVLGPGDVMVSFDAPVVLAGTRYLPDKVVRITAGTVSLFFGAVPPWKPGANLDALALVPRAGYYPDGTPSRPGLPLRVAKAAGGNLTLTWGDPCDSLSVAGSGIYGGSLAALPAYDHASISCRVPAVTSATIATPSGSAVYFLVAPFHWFQDGSYGRNSAGTERPQGPSPCISGAAATTCAW